MLHVLEHQGLNKPGREHLTLTREIFPLKKNLIKRRLNIEIAATLKSACWVWFSRRYGYRLFSVMQLGTTFQLDCSSALPQQHRIARPHALETAHPPIQLGQAISC
jgi:hypothetical protein